MPHYKLVYFNARGRAEHIRMMFEYAGVKYEDHRLEHSSWPDHKSKTPFGQLPVLEIDDEPIAQSSAIARYVARETGLDGKSSLDKLRVDMILESVIDAAVGLRKWREESDPEKKEEVLKKYAETSLHIYFSKLNAMVENNSTGFAVGSSLTLADIVLANIYADLPLIVKCHDFKQYTALAALQKKVHGLPKIKDWLERRPKTQF